MLKFQRMQGDDVADKVSSLKEKIERKRERAGLELFNMLEKAMLIESRCLVIWITLEQKAVAHDALPRTSWMATHNVSDKVRELPLLNLRNQARPEATSAC